MVVDVENADDAGDGGGGLHVGVLQAHLHGGVNNYFKFESYGAKAVEVVNANNFNEILKYCLPTNNLCGAYYGKREFSAICSFIRKPFVS